MLPKITVIHRLHEYSPPRSRVWSLRSRSACPHRGAGRQRERSIRRARGPPGGARHAILPLRRPWPRFTLHLTPENHQAVLARASGRSRREIEAQVAELAPRPDVPSSVRKLPGVAPTAPPPLSATTPPPAIEVKPTDVMAPESAPPISAPAALPVTRHPIVKTTSPERYRVQFTIGKESHDKLGAFRHFSVVKSRMVIRRPMRVREQGWTPMHRARLPGVPSHPALRAGRSNLHREHLAALPAPQSIRGGAGLWSSQQGQCYVLTQPIDHLFEFRGPLILR